MAIRNTVSIEDTIGYRQNVPACAVCGKNVQGRGGFARVNRNGHLIELCCPLCLETFENDPDPYLRRLERTDYFRYQGLIRVNSEGRVPQVPFCPRVNLIAADAGMC